MANFIQINSQAEHILDNLYDLSLSQRSGVILCIAQPDFSEKQCLLLLAKTVLCQNNQNKSKNYKDFIAGYDCNCNSCQQFTARSHSDFLEITPENKSNTISIDQIRLAIEFLSQKHVLSILVIHPVEAMTLAAQNCFLKTLEEPPANSLILLYSEQFNTLPATLRSRCQIVHLSAFTQQDSESININNNINILIEQLILLTEHPEQLIFIAENIIKNYNQNNHKIDKILDDLVLLCLNISYVYFKINNSYIKIDNINRIDIIELFNCVEEIYNIKKLLNNKINLNAELLIQNILINFLKFLN